MRTTGRKILVAVLVLVGAVSVTSCVDERIIFRDRPIFLEPADAALEFLGYADPGDPAKLTVCGQCHVGQQMTWELTGHADAWATLQASPAARELCEACHSVNTYGNVAGESGEAAGGWVATGDARYHDVQCESCHGPGLPHVRNPSIKNVQPHAPITVGTLDARFGCAECHSGFHQPFVEEWERSPHGNVTAAAASRLDDAGGCYSCHSGEGALLRLGVRSNYLEKEQLLASGENFAQITCAVCHDPHSNEHPNQLRFASNTGNVEEHICAQCHNRATVPGVGPRGLNVHAPEAPLVDGQLHTVGWTPPGMELDQDRIRGTHGSPTANPQLCSTCHVVAFDITDADGLAFRSVGHGFRAIPCVDENGIPTGELNCAMSTTARDWRGCTANGCHGDPEAAVSATNAALTRILGHARNLYGMLRTIDPNLAAPGGEIDPTNPIFTVAEGAYFNLQVAHHGTPVHSAGFNVPRADSLAAFAPSVVHNPFLVERLLLASIEAVQNEYGAQLSPAQRSYDVTSRLRELSSRK